MGLILGMDFIVFVAWILTIISAFSCIVYGIYYEFIKKTSVKKKKKSNNKEDK
jgi:hypothetical protein